MSAKTREKTHSKTSVTMRGCKYERRTFQDLPWGCLRHCLAPSRSCTSSLTDTTVMTPTFLFGCVLFQNLAMSSCHRATSPPPQQYLLRDRSPGGQMVTTPFPTVTVLSTRSW